MFKGDLEFRADGLLLLAKDNRPTSVVDLTQATLLAGTLSVIRDDPPLRLTLTAA